MNKINKIKNNWEFQKIYRKGRYAVSNALVVYVQPNHLEINRLGITASKKYGISVKRNRIRRLIRECYRLFQEKLKQGYDFVIVARKTDCGEDPGFNQIYKEMRYLMKRLNVIEQEMK